MDEITWKGMGEEGQRLKAASGEPLSVGTLSSPKQALHYSSSKSVSRCCSLLTLSPHHPLCPQDPMGHDFILLIPGALLMAKSESGSGDWEVLGIPSGRNGVDLTTVRYPGLIRLFLTSHTCVSPGK